MLIYIILDVVAAILAILLAYFVIGSRNNKTKEGKLFVAIAATFLLWGVASYISASIDSSYTIALIATRIVFPAGFLILVLLHNLVMAITKEKYRTSTLFRSIMTGVLLIVFSSPLTVSGIYETNDMYGINFASSVYIYGLAMVGVFIAILGLIAKNWNNSKPFVRRQIRAIGLGFIISAPLMLLFGYIIPSLTNSFELNRLTLAPSIILLATIYYATIRHGLFELRVVAIRTMTYVLTLSVLTAVYFLLAYILSLILFQDHPSSSGLSISPLNVILALVMASIFQPIKQGFDKLTNNIFYRGTYDQEKFLKEFSHILSYNTDINILIDRASEYITSNLKASAIGFYIQDRDLSKSKGESSLRFSSNTLKAIEESIPKGKEDIILTDQLEPGKLSKILNHHKVKIIIPMRLNNKVVGYMFLGEHKNGNYDIRDFRVLESIISELVIAIQNSLSVEVIRDLNDNLQQKVEDATIELRKSNEKLKELDKTKDEFLSIASHQLRTPLTSIKGYVDMLREGDFGEINEAQKGALDETFSSSERMVRLINDFLNISRLQTGKFTIEKHPTNLSELVLQEVNLLKLVANQSNIKIDAKIDDVTNINIDAEKVRQVVLNMIDNAIFYSKPDSTIKVKLKKTSSCVEFTVKDTGIGVPQKDQERLFGKFFRASNARKRRPDGTGVGLFLSRKVISGHKGEVIFTSEEGKGSTFGFRFFL